MPALSEYSNVEASAIEVLRRKGFQVWRDAQRECYGAERDGWDFLADSPTALLGLVGLFEYIGPDVHSEYWWRVARDDSDLPNRPHPYTSVIHRRSNA
ncbi:hypothetical protein [Cellulomonas sp. NPDC089187]|uniref:hypothetical protein n=1 Tax=Cellulomonas sp. NPDC089187 TaxID=3154970 RepID=UPI00341D15BA